MGCLSYRLCRGFPTPVEAADDYADIAPHPPSAYLKQLMMLFDRKVTTNLFDDRKEMTMSTNSIKALHEIHTATNDVLKGYREMMMRAEPDIQTVIRRLTEMHLRHASEQEAELARLRHAGQDDSSLQGTVNKVVVILRDWLTDLDRDVLPAVRKGEESLRDQYDNALDDLQAQEEPSVVALLKAQYESISREIARLPEG